MIPLIEEGFLKLEEGFGDQRRVLIDRRGVFNAFEGFLMHRKGSDGIGRGFLCFWKGFML